MSIKQNTILPNTFFINRRLMSYGLSKSSTKLTPSGIAALIMIDVTRSEVVRAVDMTMSQSNFQPLLFMFSAQNHHLNHRVYICIYMNI